MSGIIGTIFTVPGMIFIIGLLLMRSFKMLMDKRFNLRKGLTFGSFAIFGIIAVFNDSSFLNNLPTNQPIENLMTTYYISAIGGGLIVLGLVPILLYGTLNKMIKDSTNQISIKDALFSGMIVTLVMIAAQVLVGSFQLDLNPNFARFNLTSYYPMYDTLNVFGFFGPIAFNIFLAAILFEITNGWSNDLKKNLLAFLLVVGVYTSDIGFQYDIILSIGLALVYGAVIFMIFKFIIRNNYAMIPFYTLFMKLYERFAITDFGKVVSYPNENWFMLAALLISVFVMISLTKKLFNISD